MEHIDKMNRMNIVITKQAQRDENKNVTVPERKYSTVVIFGKAEMESALVNGLKYMIKQRYTVSGVMSDIPDTVDLRDASSILADSLQAQNDALAAQLEEMKAALAKLQGGINA